MEAEFKSIVLLLTTQAMMNLGEINDPVNNIPRPDEKNALLFISLLEELQLKTKGNLDAAEEGFLAEVITNLNRIFKNKFKEGLEQ
ncbi:MAG: DUF1844 domain-containing protein [Acidobacteriota bacterium]